MKFDEKYVDETGLGDLWRKVAGDVQEHIIARKDTEHAGAVMQSLLTIAAKVARTYATWEGERIDVDTFAEMAHDRFSVVVDTEENDG